MKGSKEITLPAELYRDIWLALEDQRAAAEKQIMATAVNLANLADCPNDIAVKHGLNVLKDAVAKRDGAADLLNRLEGCE